MPISAWDSFAKADSPNGRFTAAYDDATEIAMGAPTSGVITVTEKQTGSCIAELRSTNGSFVWASDSSALAFPRWTRSKMQQLVVLRLSDGTTEPLTGEYRVLELGAFHENVIEGIDSPIHLPAVVRVDLKTTKR